MAQRSKIVWFVGGILFLAVVNVVVLPGIIHANDTIGAGWVSKIVSLQGDVRIRRHGQTHWQPAKMDDALFAGDQILVESNSRAGILLSNETMIRLDQNTSLLFTGIKQERSVIIRLFNGVASFFSHRPRSLKILTPFVNGAVDGTEFLVQVDTDQTRIDLFEGRILAENEFGTLKLDRGEGVVAKAGKAPRRHILVQTRESIQWAMYYPPVLTLGTEPSSLDMDKPLALFNEGRTAEAFARMETIDTANRDVTFFVFRAAMLLHVGRTSRAQSDIRQALSLDPANSDAMALTAVIDVVQNSIDAAVDTARQVVQNAPQSASAYIALSYALQAQFKLSEALEFARQAVVKAPYSGLAWARLADLQLSVGDLDKGVSSAQKAVRFAPRTAHAHTVLGFAHLTRMETKKASDAFNKAIDLDSAAPLPRLGLGLAKIRNGDLTSGRSEIEIAAGLDPGNSLIRSYLGKAYFDEKRDPQDAQEFKIAKSLDSNDPTPWFYDAIRKQSINRPVEALQDLQKSIELNENRAVYRSRLMLDEDLAARSAGLGRIYNELDFHHLAMKEGYKSLHEDSTNYSAHRLLADAYAVKPRHEIARVSELIQSQLFQPLNLAPVQPQIAETKMPALENTGPADLGATEFNQLFTRNRLSLLTGGLTAGYDTWGNEVTVSGIYDIISASAGLYKYQTDGFRKNNDKSRDIYNFFIQGKLTPKTSVQAEYKISEKESGDLSKNFNDAFSEYLRNELNEEYMRIGAYHAFSPNIEMVASFIHSVVDEKQTNLISVPPPLSFLSPTSLPFTFNQKIDGDLFEFRTDFHHKTIGLTAGFTYMDGTVYQDSSLDANPLIDNETANFEKENFYTYASIDLNKNAMLTLGLSAAAMKVGSQIEQEQLNPKVGLTLQPFDRTTMRLAAYRCLASTYVSSQTVEPTHVAGFNQFFDDLDGSDIKYYGIGIDQQISKRLFSGIEYLYRDLDSPEFIIEQDVKAEFYDWEEHTCIAYLYWVPLDFLSYRVEYQFETFDRGDNSISSCMVDVETHRIPLSINYFFPSGVSFKLAATYFSQKGEFSQIGGDNYSGSDDFWVVDTELSYRMPKRFGILTIGVKNLFNETFNYQETDPWNPSVVPKFLAFGKMTISF